MERPRSLARWKKQYSYEGVSQFLGSQIESGVHSIDFRGTHLDLLVTCADSSTTLVSFHAALSPRAKTLPSLQGSSVAKDVGVNLIAVSDPALAKGDIDLGWFAGDSGTGPLRGTLAPLIRHAAEQLGTKRLILFGPSGGGYAAVAFGNEFPGSVVLAVNPRLDLGARPKSQVEKYLEVAHGKRKSKARKRS